MNVKKAWLQLAVLFDRLSARERNLITVGAFILPLIFFYTTWIEPNWLGSRSMSQQLKQNQTQLNALQQQLLQTEQVIKTDPNQALRQQLKDINKQIKALDELLDKEAAHLVSPNQLPHILESLIKAIPQLELEKLQTLPAQEVVLPNQSVSSKTDRHLFQHSLEMVFARKLFGCVAIFRKTRSNAK